MRTASRQLHSYCFNATKNCKLFLPDNASQLSSHLQENNTGTFSLMGAGNSFGDVFLPSEHVVYNLSGLDRILELDENKAQVRVEGGVHVGELQEFLLQRGFYLPSCSGSINNTVAGDFSSNINGKDSWKFGHYARNVEQLVFLDTKGEEHTVKHSDSELFNALAGGLGLVGIIVELTLTVKPIVGTNLRVSRKSSSSLKETIVLLNENCKSDIDYAYAWVDPLSKGDEAGRGIIEMAQFVEGNDTGLNELKSIPDSVFGIPDDFFWGAYRKSWNVLQWTGLDRSIYKLVNASRYRWLKNKKSNSEIGYFKYQFPMMSTLPNWNKRFVKHGMQEIQCIFSEPVFVNAVMELWEIMKEFGVYPELAAIRKHKADEGYLSFAADGFSTTLNYDRFGKSEKALFDMERRLMQTIVKAGGKVYLAKFPYLMQDEFFDMYPEYSRLLAQKGKYDSESRLVSSSSQRLFSGLI